MPSDGRGRGAPYAPRPRGLGWWPVRVVHRASKGSKADLPMPYTCPSTLSAQPDVGPGGGVDLNAIGRVLAGGYPQPKLTKTEAFLAWTLIIDPFNELSAAEIADVIGVSDRTVTRWRTERTRDRDAALPREGETMGLEWQEYAACARMDPEHWFPRTYHRQPEFAIVVCWSQCPVRMECLRHAMADESGMTAAQRKDEGVWGGHTPAERAAIQDELDRDVPAGRVLAA